MEKLRHKFSQKPWNETMKLVHFCMDKPRQTRATSTATSDCPLTSCLEKIERTLHARSLSAVVNRLESLSKQMGLNSYVSPSGTACYITSEMFYIEIYLENDGTVKDVKVAHPGKSPLTCEDLLQLLRMENYDAFGKILEDLLNLYQIPGNSSTKVNVHIALQTLEKDLCSLSVLHRTPDMDRITEILCGKVGYISPRTGGIPLSLEFYLSPYQILEEQLNPGLQISGMKVFLTMGQADEKHTFPLSPLVADSVSGEDGSPNVSPLTEVVCMDLLACFFLTFHQPFPMSLSSIHELQKLTGIPIAGLQPAPLHELIVQLALSEKCKDDPTMSNFFFVSLPDCPKHSYFIDTSTERPCLTGAMVNNLPFAHYKCVPEMIEILRHQAAYNTLISSCTSVHTKCEDSSDLLYFEVSPHKVNSFSVTFQHPLEENLACVVIDVLSSKEVRCTLRTISEDAALNCSNDFLTRVVKRCMSIPVLMRTIFKRATKQEAAKAVQCMEGTFEQSPNENEESKSANSWVCLPSAGDAWATLSNSPEESLPETSGQASLGNSSEENYSSPLETCGQASLGNSMEENYCSPLETCGQASLGNSMEENYCSPLETCGQASLGNSMEENDSSPLETCGQASLGNSMEENYCSPLETCGQASLGNSTEENDSSPPEPSGQASLGNSTEENDSSPPDPSGQASLGNSTEANVSSPPDPSGQASLGNSTEGNDSSPLETCGQASLGNSMEENDSSPLETCGQASLGNSMEENYCSPLETCGQASLGNSTEENDSSPPDPSGQASLGNSMEENYCSPLETCGQASLGNSTEENDSSPPDPSGQASLGNSTEANISSPPDPSGQASLGNSTEGNDSSPLEPSGQASLGNSMEENYSSPLETCGQALLGNSMEENDSSPLETCGQASLGNSTEENDSSSLDPSGQASLGNSTEANDSSPPDPSGHASLGNSTEENDSSPPDPSGQASLGNSMEENDSSPLEPSGQASLGNSTEENDSSPLETCGQASLGNSTEENDSSPLDPSGQASLGNSTEENDSSLLETSWQASLGNSTEENDSSLLETSWQASLGNSTEENASVEPSGDAMEENASLELSDDDME